MKLPIVILCGALIGCQNESATIHEKDKHAERTNQKYELALDEYRDGVIKLQGDNPKILLDYSEGYKSVEDDYLKLEYSTSMKPTSDGAYLLNLTLKETGQVIEIVLPP